MEIFEVSCNKFLKSFYLWFNDTVNNKRVRQCSKTSDIMEIINLNINQNLKIILENDRLKSLKIEAIKHMNKKFMQGLSI